MDTDNLSDVFSLENLSLKTSKLHCPSSDPRRSLVNTATFSSTFPFHVLFDRNLEIIQAGTVIRRGLVQYRCRHTRLLLDDMFDIVRPRIPCTFKSFQDSSHVVFVVMAKPGVFNFGPLGGFTSLKKDTNKFNINSGVDLNDDNSKVAHEVAHTNDHGDDDSINNANTIRLKGQMVYLPETDKMLFLCSPRFGALDELTHHKLHLADIPLHDTVRSLLLMSFHRRGERSLMDRLEQTSVDLQVLHAQLHHEKQRNEELLMKVRHG